MLGGRILTLLLKLVMIAVNMNTEHVYDYELPEFSGSLLSGFIL